jgi:hypothetical protein
MPVGLSLNALLCYEWRRCQDTVYSTDFPPCHSRLEDLDESIGSSFDLAIYVPEALKLSMSAFNMTWL